MASISVLMYHSSRFGNIWEKQGMDELNFKCGNPGAVRFGNFINYYKFHPPESRIAMFPKDIWNLVIKHTEKCCILDIGCNTGDLTMAVYDFMKKTLRIPNCSILGIDIDPTLIQRAQEKNSEVRVTFKSFDIMADNHIEKNPVFEFLKLENRSHFDIIFCFSISMWIHLNYGDDGLKQFLKKVSDLTNFLVIEPQPWKCYKTAVKRLKLSNSEFPKFKELKIRHNVEEEIENFISNHCGLVKVNESDRTEWGRKLLFFQRILHSGS